VLRAKKCVPNSLFFRCFHFIFTFESIKELGSMLILILMLCGAEHLIFVVENVVSARAFCSKPFREDLNWIVPIKLLKKGSFVCKHNILVKFIGWPIWDRGTYFEWVPCKTSPCLLEYCMNMQKRVDALQLFKGLKSESKWKTSEGKGAGAHSLAHNTLRGRGACWSSRMGLGRVNKLHSLTQACTQPTQGG